MISPEHSAVSMTGGIIQNKWIIREASINDSIKLLSSQPALANMINSRRSKTGFILSFISPLMTRCEHTQQQHPPTPPTPFSNTPPMFLDYQWLMRIQNVCYLCWCLFIWKVNNTNTWRSVSFVVRLRLKGVFGEKKTKKKKTNTSFFYLKSLFKDDVHKI